MNKFPSHHRVRERVPLRCVRVRFWAELLRVPFRTIACHRWRWGGSVE
ncbi:MAG: hypothetical protein ACOX52_16420 [Verrucomicrobiota bacterium]